VDIRSVAIIFEYEYIDSLLFYDGNNKLVESYDPNGFIGGQNNANWNDREFHTYHLADDEELIGVYGVKDYYSNITMFGYIVKVKPPAGYEGFHQG